MQRKSYYNQVKILVALIVVFELHAFIINEYVREFSALENILLC